jgi:hypothetical protein
MSTLRSYFTRLTKQCLALKLKWEHTKAIGRTRSRWKEAIQHPAAPHKKPHKEVRKAFNFKTLFGKTSARS